MEIACKVFFNVSKVYKLILMLEIDSLAAPRSTRECTDKKINLLADPRTAF